MAIAPTDADYLPPEPPPRSEKQPAAEAAPPRPPGRWGDRVLFLGVGLVLGFTAAYVYLDSTRASAPLAAVDPHANVPGMGPGATRDMPDGAGGAPPAAASASAREKQRELEEAVAKDPKNYDLLVMWGNTSYDAEDFRQAIVAYERAVAIKATDANVLTDLGVSYRNTGQIDKALEHFTKALAVDPKHGPALFNTAIVYGVDKGDAARARELLERLKKEHPQIPSLDRLEKLIQERAAKTGA